MYEPVLKVVVSGPEVKSEVDGNAVSGVLKKGAAQVIHDGAGRDMIKIMM